MTISTTNTAPTPEIKASYSAGDSLPTVGSDAYNKASALATAARSAPTARVNPDTIVSPAKTNLDDVKSDNQNIEINLRNSDASALVQYTQGLTDSINAKFATINQNQKDQNASMDARAYALNTSRGLKDSGTGTAALNTEQAKGKQALDKEASAQQAEMAGALGKVDILRGNLQKSEIALHQKNSDEYNKLATQNKKDGLDSLTGLAKGNVDLETLKAKEPDSYNALKKATGYSDLEMTAKFNSLKPVPPKMQYKVVGDTVTAYGVDKDGKLIVQDEKVPGMSSGKYSIKQTTDGSLYKVNAETGEVTTLHGPESKAPKPAKPIKPLAPTSYSRNQETDAQNWLARQSGFDNKKDSDAFKNDPEFKAWAIKQAEDEKTATKNSSKKTPKPTSNPFSSK